MQIRTAIYFLLTKYRKYRAIIYILYKKRNICAARFYTSGNIVYGRNLQRINTAIDQNWCAISDSKIDHCVMVEPSFGFKIQHWAESSVN